MDTHTLLGCLNFLLQANHLRRQLLLDQAVREDLTLRQLASKTASFLMS